MRPFASTLLCLFLLAPMGAAMTNEPMSPTQFLPPGDLLWKDTARTSTEEGPADPWQALAHMVDRVETDTGYDAHHPLAPDGLRGLSMVAQEGAQQNGTQGNLTEGPQTHRHNGVKGVDLDILWETSFHGIPTELITADLDGDGVDEIIAATDVGVVLMDEDGIRWSHGLGSRVTALFLVDADGDGMDEIGLGTAWGALAPRIAVLDHDGVRLWEHETASSIVTAEAVGDGSGDILAVQVTGKHMRISSNGDEVWSRDVDVVSSTGTSALLAYAYVYNLGHYLADVGDINGDGVDDTVSANMVWASAYAFSPFVPVGTSPDEYITLVHAVDGKTGNVLWSAVNPGVPGNLAAFNILFDLDLLDANGDGAQDVSYTYFGYAWEYVQTFVWVYSTGFRVYDGASEDVGELIGARDLIQPELPIAIYSSLEHTDIEGDGRDELVVAHSGLMPNLVTGESTAIERYAVPAGTDSDVEMVLLGHSALGVTNYLDLHGLELDDGRHTAVSFFDLVTGGYVEIAPDGTIGDEVRFPGTVVLSSASWQDQMAYALLEGVASSGFSDLGSTDGLVPFFGAPVVVEALEYNQDATRDVAVLGSDGNVHIRDGLDGTELAIIDEALPILDMAVVRADPAIIVLETIKEDPDQPGWYVRMLEARDSDGQTLWKSGTDTYMLWSQGKPLLLDGDGDGVQDIVIKMNNRYDSDSSAWKLNVVVLSGATGDTLFDVRVDGPGSGTFWADAIQVATINGHEDLVMVDGWNGIMALDGQDGGLLFSEEFENSWYQMCLGAYDHDKDGQDTVVLIRSRWDEPETITYTNGTSKTIGTFLPVSGDLFDCRLDRVPGPLGDDLAVSWTGWDEDGSGGIGVYRDGVGFLWTKENTAVSDSFSRLRIIGIDTAAPARMLAEREDHIFSYAVSDGSQLGEFTFNGPWLLSAGFIDLDGLGNQEIYAVSADGVLRAISDERDQVKEVLDQKVEQASTGPVKDTPALALPLVGLLVLAFAAVHRRRNS